MVINGTEVVYSYLLRNSSVVSRLVLSSSGQLECWVGMADGKKWQLFFQLQRDFCDGYNICYAYGTCSVSTSQRCGCLDETRFVPRNQKAWEISDWSGGCVRRTPLDCRTDGFIKYSHVKLPDTRTLWYNMRMNRKECEEKCIKNCSCMAYSDTDIRGEGSGCLLWFNDLMDIRVFSQSNNGQDIFVRMAYSELVHEKKERANLKIILPVVFLGVLLIGVSSTWFHYACRKSDDQQLWEGSGEFLDVGRSQRDAMELPLFSFSTLARATARFSPENKIGEGGFGSVYKCVLERPESLQHQAKDLMSLRMKSFAFQNFSTEILLDSSDVAYREMKSC
ncbi:G-type lectin S-receptor-like serine/threonine-protein kinase At4g27290 isoform X1 [Lactuca sativa]|uniref:G-type lectin S-receptor-like serine/threonine-protein kinase At4g27290 isoform X1 n=1 Tax=Lactuca sativa TaxID=4236 RepID=UPI0022AEC4F0|nr:G-type lectin S-receptor-like serine/threonine-protein kinase At4g27290 isoform X1 [Lactuca sativa]